MSLVRPKGTPEASEGTRGRGLLAKSSPPQRGRKEMGIAGERYRMLASGTCTGVYRHSN